MSTRGGCNQYFAHLRTSIATLHLCTEQYKTNFDRRESIRCHLVYFFSMSRGRPRQFNTEEALKRAMLVFWRRGYRGTSLDDITVALQINRPSVYAAFGDKEALFLQVVDYYRNQFLQPAVIKLLQCENLHEGLETYFRSQSNVISGSGHPPGCMIACLLSEECCESDAIKQKLTSFIDTADHNFTTLFENHRDELNPVLTPAQAGKLLLSTLQGIAIRARSGAKRKELLEIGEVYLKLVVIPK